MTVARNRTETASAIFKGDHCFDRCWTAIPLPRKGHY